MRCECGGPAGYSLQRTDGETFYACGLHVARVIVEINNWAKDNGQPNKVVVAGL